MKIIFFGTPHFAAYNLKALINARYKIIAVVCPPDSKKGRGKKIEACDVKLVSQQNNIPILQPERLRNNDFIKALQSFNADLFVVVAFRMLPEIVWRLPQKGTINLHTSILPNYRGAAPINWVLINGESKTGVSTFYINKDIDSGSIIKQQEIGITNNTTAAELHNKLMVIGSQLLVETLKSISNNTIDSKPQHMNKNVLAAPKLTKELFKIDWEKSANEIHNLIRGLSPQLDNNNLLQDVAICPSAWFFLEDKDGLKRRIKIHLSEVTISNSTKLLDIKTDNKTYLHIVTSKNAISILKLQAEGKKPMKIQQFLQGNKIYESHKIL